MSICRLNEMVLLQSDSSGDCCDPTVANRGRLSLTNYEVMELLIGN